MEMIRKIRNHFSRSFLLIVLGFLFVGCASKPLYYWGHYEISIYDRLAKGNKEGPSKQIEWLRKDISFAQEKGLKLPPGFHGHLAMLYSETGDSQLSAEQLALEKKLFPESTVFIDGMLKRSRKK